MKIRLSLLITALALASCGGPSRTTLVVYSPHGKELLTAFEQEFEALHPEIDVQWLDMGSQDAYDRLRTERENPQADLWWGGPMTMFDRAAHEGLLDPYVPTWDSLAAPNARGTGGFWYGTFLTPEVIMYNTRMLDSASVPSTWDALLEPQWKGKILIRSPLASGTMRIIFSAIIAREWQRTGDSLAGFAWLRRLDANTRTYVADPTQLYLRLAREEAPLTVWDLPDVALQIERNHQPFGYRLPRDGTPVITEGIAVVHGARHRDAARLFYEFVTSRRSMIRQAREFFRIPARIDIPSDSLPRWATLAGTVVLPVDWTLLAANEQRWMLAWDERVKGRGGAAAEGR